MDSADELGWNKDEDLHGNEVYRPSLNQAALFMEMICNGTMPQLEWRNPGKRIRSTEPHVTNPQRKSSIISAGLPMPPKETVLSSAGTPLAEKPLPASASPFDFDDSESVQAAATVHALSISPVKLEPRKRVLGSINNALNAVQAGIEKTKDVKVTSPSPSAATPTAVPDAKESHMESSADGVPVAALSSDHPVTETVFREEASNLTTEKINSDVSAASGQTPDLTTPQIKDESLQ